MRRIAAAVLTVILILSLAIGANAASKASHAELSAAVASNGSCQVTLDLQLHLDAAPGALTIPLPSSARSVSVNGSHARTSRSGDTLLVDLSGLLGKVTGDFTLLLQYTLPNVVQYNDLDQPEISLPLLSGFVYPIESMDFSVTLPGSNETKPSFTSGYYQQSIESDLNCTFSGNTVAGSILVALKDRETLTMILPVSEDMFPRDPIRQWSVGTGDVVMIVLAVLAALYWLIFLRCAPFLRRRSAQPPEGFTAGEIPCALAGQGADLTMLVLSWAQLGYILIHLDDSGRVMLHKRMDMGNERSGYEIRTFRSLFGKRSIVDGTGYHYANLYRKVAATQADIHALYRRSTGNPLVFRALCALIGLFGGISIGIALVGDALLGILLIAILAVLGAVSAWFMQNWALGLHMRYRFSLLIGLGLGGIWLLIGAAAGVWYVSVGMVAAQLIGGLACVYGGKRTPYGRQTVSEFLGLRSYLKHFPVAEVRRLCAADPAYYFSLAPYAIALGVGRPFAARFGNMRLPACPYLTTGIDAHLTAAQWHLRFTEVISALDLRQKRLPIERLLGR